MHTPDEHLFAVSLKPGDRALTDYTYRGQRGDYTAVTILDRTTSRMSQTGVCYRIDPVLPGTEGPFGWLDAHWFWPVDKVSK